MNELTLYFLVVSLLIGTQADSIVLEDKCNKLDQEICNIVLLKTSNDSFNDCTAFSSNDKICSKINTPSDYDLNSLSDSRLNKWVKSKNRNGVDVEFQQQTVEEKTADGKMNQMSSVGGQTVMRRPDVVSRIRRNLIDLTQVSFCECSKSKRSKRNNVAIEQMFGLRSYDKNVNSEPKAAPKPAHVYMETTQSFELDDDDCGTLSLADSSNLESNLSVTSETIEKTTIRGTHATTVKNCWSLCNDNTFSTTEKCVAVGFIEGNSKKPVNDCYLLSEVPKTSIRSEGSVRIFSKCV